MSHIFISHSSLDHKVAALIRERLEKAGISTWMATANLKPGEDWEKEIDSPSVSYEYKYILRQNLRLYPVIAAPIDDDDLPSRLRRLQAIDLTEDPQHGLDELVHVVQTRAERLMTESERSRVSVRLEVDRDKLSSLLETLTQAGVESIKVESVGKRNP
jgi:hypothetical protein